MKTKFFISLFLVLVVASELRSQGTNARLGDSALAFNRDTANTAVGFRALKQNRTGRSNTAVGSMAALENISGIRITALGYQALNRNLGDSNSALGARALASNSLGKFNTAIGSEALLLNGIGNKNTAIGGRALQSNYGSENVGVGYESLLFNSGNKNTAVGFAAMRNGGGYDNVAFGAQALSDARNANENTAIGARALRQSQGANNTAVGFSALSFVTTGNRNVGVGREAGRWLVSGNSNTIIGSNYGPSSSASWNTFIGFQTFSSIPNVSTSTAIGFGATVTASNQVRFGDNRISSIGSTVGWTTLSDGRVKEDVKEDVPGLELVTKLRPVTYTVNTRKVDQLIKVNRPALLPISARRETGFIAQEVSLAVKNIGFEFSGIDAPKNDNNLFSLRYDQFVLILVKAVQELSVLAEQQQQQLDRLRERVNAKQNYDLAPSVKK